MDENIDLKVEEARPENIVDSADESGDDFSSMTSSKNNISPTSKNHWKKAKGILRHFSESTTTSSTNESAESSSPPAAILTSTFFTTLSPEMCVDLLRHTSPKVYKNVRNRIAEADNEWMEGFFRANGLNVLFEMLEQLTDSKQFCESSLANVLMPMYCVECVKAFMKNSQAMHFIIGEPDYAYKLVQAISSDKFAVRSSAIQLLSALAYYSEKGCEVVLNALQRFQQKSSKQHWTEIVVAELKHPDLDYTASLMALVNCIMFNVTSDRRIKIRNELLAVGLKDLLSKLHEQASNNDRLSIQLGLFEEYGEKDRRRMASRFADDSFLTDVNFDDPYDLFDAIMRKVNGLPSSAKLLTILQSLSVLDADGACSYQQWDIIEQIALTLGSLDPNMTDVENILNFWQSRIYSTLASTSSFKDSGTQTTGDSEIFSRKLDENNNNDSSMSYRQHKKRMGIKKRISAFLGLAQSSKDQDESGIADVDSKATKWKKKPSSYKIKNRGRLSSSSHNKKSRKASEKTGLNGSTSDMSSDVQAEPFEASLSALRNRRSLSGTVLNVPKETSIRDDLTRRCSEKRNAAGGPYKATSLDTLFNENSKCPLVACRQLIKSPKALSRHRKGVSDTASDSATVTASSDVTTKASASATGQSAATSDVTTTDAAHSSAAATAVALTPEVATHVPTAPPPPPVMFLANKSYAPARGSEAVKPSPTIRAIIPAPQAMLAESPSRFSGPKLPPPTMTGPPAPPPPPPSLVNLKFGIPMAPPPPPTSLAGVRPMAPPPPPSLAGLKPVPPPLPMPGAEGKFQCQNVAGLDTNAAPGVNEHFYTFPLQKGRKTKTLYWNKLTPYTLNDKKGTMWGERVDLSIDDLNLKKIEELFSCDTTPSSSLAKNLPEKDAGTSASTSSTGPAVTVAAPSSKMLDEVYLVDQKTSLKISLFLKQFRNLSLEKIVETVVSKDVTPAEEEQLTLERLRGLQRCLVGVEQYIVDVQNYDGDYSKLGFAEKFLWHVGHHKFFSTCLEVKCIQKEFDDKNKNFASSFDTLLNCCQNLKNNESLKNFLFITLRVGNYLNLGSSGGPAAGFKISSIKQLYSLKATRQNSTTLLHVLVENAELLAKMNFTSQVSNVHQAAKIDYESTKTELNVWTGELKKIMQQVRATNDATFIEQAALFFINAENTLKILNDKIKEVESATKSLQEYFCDDLKLSDLLNLFSEFFKSVDQAKMDNEQRKLKEERLAKQKEMQDLRKTYSAPQMEKRRSSSSIASKKDGPAATSEDNLVENLLTKIRDGDIGPRAKEGGGGPQSLPDRLVPVGPRRQRTFVKSFAPSDQGRERSTRN